MLVIVDVARAVEVLAVLVAFAIGSARRLGWNAK